jgi:Flp pilus assembly protein TadD
VRNPFLTPVKPPLRCLASALLVCAALAAHADEAADIARLRTAGDFSAALQRTETALLAQPRDAALRFTKGVLLADLGRVDDAMAMFGQLVEDHPELAEPYNNLAALHAGRGEIDAARLSLEQAIRARPDYSVAHENLGDTYLMLAARAYSEAARLDTENRSAPVKLQLVRNLLQAPAGANRKP